MRRFLSWLSVCCLLASFAACGENTGPGGRPNAELNLVRQDTLSPALVATQVTLWAKVGEGRDVRLEYAPGSPADSNEDFLRFEVPGDGLLRKPDGSAFQPGDSILITITVVDSSRFLFRFEPAGLVFNPEHPARLKIHYFGANHDFDHDGDIDAADTAIEHELDLWRRETTTSPWFRIGSVKFEELDELDANILSFTEYAVAW